MRRPPLPPGLTWFLTRPEVHAVIGDHINEVSLHWLSQYPPHEVPLLVTWEPQRGFTGPVYLFVGSVTDDQRSAIAVDAVAQSLRRWIEDALSATPVWQSQRHQRAWRIVENVRVVIPELDLDPSDHQA